MTAARLLALTLLAAAAVVAQAQTFGENSTLVSVSAQHLRYDEVLERDGNGLQTYQPGQSQTAVAKTTTAWAVGSASAASGTLHCSAETTLSEDLFDGHRVTAGATAAFYQMVTLTNPYDIGIVIPISLTLDGNWSGIGSATADLYVWEGEDQVLAGMAVGVGYLQNLPRDTATLFVPAKSDYTVAIQGHLTAGAQSHMDSRHGVADFSHTAHFLWDLPSGVTATGVGGEFHPGSITPVPEPASMLVLGLGAVGLLRRRLRA